MSPRSLYNSAGFLKHQTRTHARTRKTQPSLGGSTLGPREPCGDFKVYVALLSKPINYHLQIKEKQNGTQMVQTRAKRAVARSVGGLSLLPPQCCVQTLCTNGKPALEVCRRPSMGIATV